VAPGAKGQTVKNRRTWASNSQLTGAPFVYELPARGFYAQFHRETLVTALVTVHSVTDATVVEPAGNP